MIKIDQITQSKWYSYSIYLSQNLDKD